jgi:hypothetical protein
VDLSPFERDFPKLSSPEDIGHGVEFLNRHLSSCSTSSSATRTSSTRR